MKFSIIPQDRPTTKPNRDASLKGTSSILGLSAGAIGWSTLAQAASEEAGLQTVMMPGSYSFEEDGGVLLSLITGERVVLLEDQYVILGDGLLIIVDELTQAAISKLPVIGALRTEIFTEGQTVRSPDGTVIKASNARPLWSGEGEVPRLFEQVDIQRYELAQEPLGEEEEALMVLSGGAIAGSLLAVMALAPRPAEEQEDTQEEESPVVSNTAPFWVDYFDGSAYPDPYATLTTEGTGTAGGIYGIADHDSIMDLVWSGAGTTSISNPASERDSITITVVDIQTDDIQSDDPVPVIADYVHVTAGPYNPPNYGMSTGILGVIIQPNNMGLPPALSGAVLGDTWTLTLMIEDQFGGSDTLVTEWSM